jgi:hypothetical protein
MHWLRCAYRHLPGCSSTATPFPSFPLRYHRSIGFTASRLILSCGSDVCAGHDTAALPGGHSSAGWSRRSIRTRAAGPQIWHAVQVTGTRCSTDRQSAVTGCLHNPCSGSAWAAIGWCIKITFRDFSRARFPVPKFYLVGGINVMRWGCAVARKRSE